jgi:hypothetical protein
MWFFLLFTQLFAAEIVGVRKNKAVIRLDKGEIYERGNIFEVKRGDLSIGQIKLLKFKGDKAGGLLIQGEAKKGDKAFFLYESLEKKPNIKITKEDLDKNKPKEKKEDSGGINWGFASFFTYITVGSGSLSSGNLADKYEDYTNYQFEFGNKSITGLHWASGLNYSSFTRLRNGTSSFTTDSDNMRAEFPFYLGYYFSKIFLLRAGIGAYYSKEEATYLAQNYEAYTFGYSLHASAAVNFYPLSNIFIRGMVEYVQYKPFQGVFKYGDIIVPDIDEEESDEMRIVFQLGIQI